jgi:hypothetical protein
MATTLILSAAELKGDSPRPRLLAWAAPAVVCLLTYALYATRNPALMAPGITPARLLALGAILYTAGFVSGLAGFAFSAIGATILLVLQPALAVPLLQGLSTMNQLVSIGQLRRQMPRTAAEWWPAGPGPAIVGGFAGVPIGVWLLNHLPAHTLTLMIGSLITAYAIFSLFKPAGLVLRGFDGARSGMFVGLFGGAIGGFTAFPGMSVVVWTALRDTPKTVTRAIVQPYVVALQVLALAANALMHPSTFGPRYWILFALMLPIVLPGTMTGVVAYRSMSDINFKRFCLAMLVISGVGLVLKAAF